MKATINGKELDFEPNETILAVARKNGIFIPTLCELNDIDHAPGTCRICLVELQQCGASETQYATACDTAMTAGCKVMTRTPKVQEMRQLQMEMIMADHHQDCASCPRNGNCELLPAANSVGLKQVRFHYTEGWKNLEPDHGSQPVIYDRSRCIRCQRCVALVEQHGARWQAQHLGLGQKRLAFRRRQGRKPGVGMQGIDEPGAQRSA